MDNFSDIRTYLNNQFNFSFNYPSNLFVAENPEILTTPNDVSLFRLGLSAEKESNLIADYKATLIIKNLASAIIPAKDNDDDLVYIIQNEYVYIFSRLGLEVEKFREIIKSFTYFERKLKPEQFYSNPIIEKICREMGPLPNKSENRLGWHARIVYTLKNSKGEIGAYFYENATGAPASPIIYLSPAGKFLASFRTLNTEKVRNEYNLIIEKLRKDFPIEDGERCAAPNRMMWVKN